MSEIHPGGPADAYHYIIVGAGAAGCVLAMRLTENPACKVLLIEAGGPDNHPFIHMPKGMPKILAMPDRTWAFSARSARGSNAPPEVWLRGKTLGGSSSVNGMMYVRGQPFDYDELARQSSAHWNWDNIAEAYRAIEDHELGGADARGVGGPLQITLPRTRTRLTDAMVEAGAAMGWHVKPDVNAPSDDETIGYAPRLVSRGRRQSNAVAFLNTAKRRRNLTILTEATVDRLSFDGLRVVGVRCGVRGVSREFRGQETLLCAGTLATPAILQRSGIGDASLLNRLGIPLMVDRPQVGAGLKEHRALVMQWRVKDAPSENAQFRGWRLVANVLRYYLTGGGPMSTATFEVGAWIKSRKGLPRPNGQFLLGAFTFDRSQGRRTIEDKPGMSLCVYPLRPRSTGSVAIRSRDPYALPDIELDYFTDGEDRREMVELFRAARTYARQHPLARHLETETLPGEAYQTDDEILEAYAKFGACGFHAVGTCRMGSDPDSVVDPELKVRGVEALRVVDLSVAPSVLAGNTLAPVTALAWRAADLLLKGARG